MRERDIFSQIAFRYRVLQEALKQEFRVSTGTSGQCRADPVSCRGAAAETRKASILVTVVIFSAQSPGRM